MVMLVCVAGKFEWLVFALLKLCEGDVVFLQRAHGIFFGDLINKIDCAGHWINGFNHCKSLWPIPILPIT